MNIYPEAKKIASYNQAVSALISKLEAKNGCDGLKFEGVELVYGCSIEPDGLHQNGKLTWRATPVNDDYLYDLRTCCIENDCYGTVWFKTNTKGQFVRIGLTAPSKDFALNWASSFAPACEYI